MKISEILEEENKFPVSAVEPAEIIKVGDIKEGSTGQYQVITIQASGHKLPCLLYNENQFLDSKDKGRIVEFQSGPPHNGKPTGLIVKVGNDNKTKLSVTGKAIMKLRSNDEEEEADTPEPPKKEELKKKAEKAIETQLTEEENSMLDDVIEGPSDHIILEEFYERLHVLKILERVNTEHGNPFTKDSLYPMVTSIIITASKAGKTILPLPTRKPKERFAPIEKPHNDPKVKEHPTDTPDEKKSEETEVDFVRRFVENNKGTIPAYKFKTPEGNTLDKVIIDDEKRVMAMTYYLSRRATPDKDQETTELYDALHEIFHEFPAYLKNYIVYEAIYFNQVDLENIKHSGGYIMDQNEEYMGQLCEQFRGNIDAKELWKMFKPYFKTPIAKRSVN